MRCVRSSVKRVVITSSVAAVWSSLPHHKVFTEVDFNDQVIEAVEKEGKKANGVAKYAASKTLAEKGVFRCLLSGNLCDAKHYTAAWDFYHKHKASINWDLTVLTPPFVFGVRSGHGLLLLFKLPAHRGHLWQPVIHEVEDPTSLNVSAAMWYENVVKQKHTETGPTNSWIDIRDLAEAHVRALERPEAGGERFIVSAGSSLPSILLASPG
jgi:nucleoside-diphosphate-sugar epimerase